MSSAPVARLTREERAAVKECVASTARHLSPTSSLEVELHHRRLLTGVGVTLLRAMSSNRISESKEELSKLVQPFVPKHFRVSAQARLSNYLARREDFENHGLVRFSNIRPRFIPEPDYTSRTGTQWQVLWRPLEPVVVRPYPEPTVWFELDVDE